jgi:hypothetical protein
MDRRSIRLAALAGVALLVVACGGSTASPAATGAASPSAEASVAPSAAASPSASAAASQAAVSPGATPDLSAIFGGSVTKLDSLTGYQIALSMEQAAGKTDINVTSVRKPVDASRYDISTPDGKKIVIVKIGNDGWVSQDGTTFVKTPAAALGGLLDAFTPEALLGGFEKQSAFKALTAVGTETKNGVQATHYHIDQNTPLPPDAAGTIPPGATADIWVSEDGFLVGLEAQGFGSDLTSMSVEVTHINDPALKVDAPE